MGKTPKQLLKEYFGYDTFRGEQEEIINTVIAGKDSVVLMPTGGGKSVCYQIPALYLEGICIVISPLIALMRDQVEGLRRNGIGAAFLNSSLTEAEQRIIENYINDGKIKLLYVSPEKILSNNFLQYLSRLNISFFAIDEAHCISQWGHDFRPEYTQLKILKEHFPEKNTIALTATADKPTRLDIQNQLALTNPKIFIASFNRPNLSLNVKPGQNKFHQILEFIDNREKDAGIVYCLSRKGTESLALKLRENGYKAEHYHAGMSSSDRSSVQDKFLKDEVLIICATIAFGMGIDKPNVRWVAHFNLPKNIEGYYQEIGRAGRDGLPSDTLLFYSIADIITLQKFLPLDNPRLYELQNSKLERMKQYAEADICRRIILLNYFGEAFSENCGNCDVCKNPRKKFDATIIVQKALSGIVRTNEEIHLNTLIDLLRGSRNETINNKGYDKIKTFGVGKDISNKDWYDYLLQMLHLGLFEIEYHNYNYLKLTETGKETLYGGKKVELVDRKNIGSFVNDDSTPKHTTSNDLFERLRNFRKELAESENVPAYLIFNDKTLKEMSFLKPTTKEDMLNISGVGYHKFDLYGEDFINEINNFINRKSKSKTAIVYDTFDVTLKYYKEGHTIEEISEMRKLAISTIQQHIAKLYEEGKNINYADFITQSELQSVISAIKKIGLENGLKPIYAFLEEKINYFKIRISVTYYKKFLGQ